MHENFVSVSLRNVCTATDRPVGHVFGLTTTRTTIGAVNTPGHIHGRQNERPDSRIVVASEVFRMHGVYVCARAVTAIDGFRDFPTLSLLPYWQLVYVERSSKNESVHIVLNSSPHAHTVAHINACSVLWD